MFIKRYRIKSPASTNNTSNTTGRCLFSLDQLCPVEVSTACLHSSDVTQRRIPLLGPRPYGDSLKPERTHFKLPHSVDTRNDLDSRLAERVVVCEEREDLMLSVSGQDLSSRLVVFLALTSRCVLFPFC